MKWAEASNSSIHRNSIKTVRKLLSHISFLMLHCSEISYLKLGAVGTRRDHQCSLWLTLWRHGNLLSTPCHLEMHSRYTPIASKFKYISDKCTSRSCLLCLIKFEQNYVHCRQDYQFYQLLFQISKMEVVFLIVIPTEIWPTSQNLWRRTLYIWAWFGRRRAYRAYKPLLWASHCASRHSSI